MTNKYIWPLFLVGLLSAAAFGQHGLSSHLDVHVTDRSGAVVPNARIEITASADSLAAVGHTDSRGIAVFDLPAGNYELMVISRGFYFKAQHFALVGNEVRSISALLDVGACPGPGHPACIEVLPGPESDSPTHAADLLTLFVTDSTGEPISGASVEVFGRQSEIKEKTSTGEGGITEFRLLPGSYVVSVTARFFRGWKREVVIPNTPHQNIRVEMDVDCGRVICGPKG
jgi:hypothetical protein